MIQKTKWESRTRKAQTITLAGSRQTFFTAQLMVDKNLVSDFYRAYAYFRWADDYIDITSQSKDERISFVKRQKELLNQLYNKEFSGNLEPEEELIADLIVNDDGKNDRLRSFISKMFAIIEFDAYRKGSTIKRSDLVWYTDCLSQSVTDGLQYFIGKDNSYPTGKNQYLAAAAAHITHLLRDMIRDLSDGFINIPEEYLNQHNLDPSDVHNPLYRTWVQGRVEQAREYFQAGKHYLDSLKVLRCKIMGYWYCARFEGVLDMIEEDDFYLRDDYKITFVWLRMLWLGVVLFFEHIFKQVKIFRANNV